MAWRPGSCRSWRPGSGGVVGNRIEEGIAHYLNMIWEITKLVSDVGRESGRT
jgi:hypothetical protein